MKRRGFLLGLAAAPVAASLPALPAPVRKVDMVPELGMGFSGGFTAAELKAVSDAIVAIYARETSYAWKGEAA